MVAEVVLPESVVSGISGIMALARALQRRRKDHNLERHQRLANGFRDSANVTAGSDMGEARLCRREVIGLASKGD
jgi:hypothetical protein